jgi:hypothetical protein
MTGFSTGFGKVNNVFEVPECRGAVGLCKPIDLGGNNPPSIEEIDPKWQ